MSRNSRNQNCITLLPSIENPREIYVKKLIERGDVDAALGR